MINMLSFLVAKDNSEKSTNNSEMKIFAKKKIIQGDLLIAEGDVEIVWQGYHIFTKRIEFNRKTKDLIAEGDIVMSSEESILTGKNLKLNLKTKKGLLEEVFGLMEPYVKYETKNLNQIDEETFRFNNLKFTSCNQINPRWELNSKKGKIKRDKYILMKNVVLRIKKIPVFYFPILKFPLNKGGKATGFLFPVIGNSNLRGFFILNSFFWNIKPNVDLTLFFDYYAKGGIGFAEEFRYLFKNMTGNIKFYYMKLFEDNILNLTSDSNYYIKISHNQNINFWNTNIKANVDMQSDPSFLRMFDNNFDRLLMNNFRTSVYLSSQPFDNLKTSVQFSRYETYYTFSNSSRILEYKPSLKLNLSHQEIWKLPGYFDLYMSYEDVLRTGVTYEEEPQFVSNFESIRLNINPSYSIDLLKLPWLFTTINMKSKNSFYAKSYDAETKEIVDEPLHLQYNMINLNLKGPIFYKFFESVSNKYKHLIEPTINFRYTTKISDEERQRLVPVDYFDYPPYSYASFGITTRILKKDKNENESAQEVFSYSILQKYYLDPEEANMYRKINGEYPKLSELSNSMRIRLSNDFSFDATANYNYYTKAFSRLNFNLKYSAEDSFLNGSIGYSSYKNPYAPPTYIFNRDTIRGSIKIDISGFPLKFDTNIDYDITNKEFRYGSVALDFNYQCMKFRAEARVFTFAGRDEFQFNFGVTLSNLGMVNDFLGDNK